VKAGPDPLVFEFQGPVLKGFRTASEINLDETDHDDLYTRISKMVKVNRNAVKRIILAAGYSPCMEGELKIRIRELEDQAKGKTVLEKCGWCEKDKKVPCMNTRDMEEAAISGNRECFYQLCRAGGGERGPMAIIASIHEGQRKKSP
jgi:hypothetical protein